MKFIELNVVNTKGDTTIRLVRKKHIMQIAKDKNGIKVLMCGGPDFDVETIWCKNDYYSIYNQLRQ